MKRVKVFAGAFLCCFLWGSAFPAIKIGYERWGIENGETTRIIGFAGVRFFLAGILVILAGSLICRKWLIPQINEIPKILLLSLFQTIGQYVLFYLGLAHTTGVNAAVVDSLTTFFAILIASLIFRMERLTLRKMIGCIIGFAGVILVNIDGNGFSFDLLGDGLIALSALCYGVSSVMIKRYSAKHDTVLFSGYQFVFGGLIMVLIGLVFGSGVPVPGEGMDITPALLVLLYLALVSSVAYTLWGLLLKNNDVSQISVFGFMTPVSGVILSALMLGETGVIGWQYAGALLLVSVGIVIVNYKMTRKNGIFKRKG